MYFIFWIASLASALIFRSKIAQIIFFLLVFIFVGLRFETAFDWPFYKDAFGALQGDFSLDLARWFAELVEIEFGFVVLLALTGQLFADYEYFQAIVTVTFLVSVLSLCRAFGVKNVALVIALAATFLLLTLMMSTVRQCLAVSVFNFALSAAVARRYISMTAFLALAMTIHVSTLFYIVALLFALAQPQRMPSQRDVVLIIFAGTAVVLNLGFLAEYLPSYLANRFFLYRLDQIILNLSLWQIYFLILSASITGYTLFIHPFGSTNDARTTFLRRVIVALGVMCMCTVLIDVVRDRITYLMFLLFALYISYNNIPLALPARVAAVTLGLFFSVFNVLAPANRTVFAPYQNIIGVAVTGDQGDGRMRQEAFRERFKRLHQQ